MRAADKQAPVRSWYFQCPECGFGDQELGQLSADDEIYCEVCLIEVRQHVPLRRWTKASDEADNPD